ncbi:MAG TPA: spermidine synthase, partial [Nitrospiraceae bacterium]|nr:spermidine synthase [Nitrospiraceae bacterium]
ALHPKPEDVLEIGMSSGSGTRVIANHLDVKKLTVVEINPGYSTLIKKYPDISTILNDPKISIHIDDGRRWLNRNPDKKFDLIAMNTTFHWRDGATNLLSEEFLRLFKSHLKKGGVIYYNTTFSGDVTFTAANVFKYIVPYSNFVAASDSPFVMSKEDIRQNLLKFRNAGKPVFDKNSLSLQHVLNKLVESDLSDKADLIRNKAGLLHITDDNMATEFKKNNRLFIPERTWTNIFRNKF